MPRSSTPSRNATSTRRRRAPSWMSRRATPCCVELETARAAETADPHRPRDRARAGARPARPGRRAAAPARGRARRRRGVRPPRRAAPAPGRGGDRTCSPRCPPCWTPPTARCRRPASRWPPPRPTARSRTRSSASCAATRARCATRLAALNENVHGLEMQAYEKRLHLSTLLERAAEELGLDEDVLVAEYGPEVPVPRDSSGGARAAETDASRSRRRSRRQPARDADVDRTTEPVRPQGSSRRASPAPSASTRSSAG